MSRNDDDRTTVQSPLEPRVAALEVGLDRLTADVKDLANVVRMQGQTVEQEIQKLVVAVTQAQGPKKTDWSTIFAGIALILAIGSAVFWPLNQKQDYTLSNLQALQVKVEAHEKLDDHPVGAAMLQRLNEQIILHADVDAKEREGLRTRLNEEVDLLRKYMDQALKAQADLHISLLTKNSERTAILERDRENQIERDRDELSQWRGKSMGLSSPDKTTALTTKEVGK